MTEWALIIMMCSRTCVPQYVEVYPNKVACEVNLGKQTSTWVRADSYCAPIVKNKDKQ